MWDSSIRVDYIAGLIKDAIENYLVNEDDFSFTKAIIELEKYFSNQNVWVEGSKPKVSFVRGKWCGDDAATVDKLKEMKITIRCIPFDQSGTEGICLITGRPATLDVIYARTY